MNSVANTDLVSLIERETGISLVKVANHFQFGPEYKGPCPWCGGDDRFCVWPDCERAHYWCRVCGRQGSLPWFLVEWKKISYPQALQELGLEEAPKTTVRHDRMKKDSPPPQQWQDMARAWVHMAYRWLWSPIGAHALAYLRSRGLSDETIRRYQLGYIPSGPNGKWMTCPLEEWGLEPARPDDKVTLFEGVLIPWYVGSQIWKLEVRKLKVKGDEPKIPTIKGSQECLFNVDALRPGEPAGLVESAFDALSGVEACGDSVVFVATGGTKQARASLWVECLKQASCTLVAFDNDDAGNENAPFWTNALPHAIRAFPGAHDLNDMLQAKFDIRAWFTNALERYELSQRSLPDPSPARRMLTDDRVIAVVKRLQYGGCVVFRIVDGRLCFFSDSHMSENIRRFVQDYEPVIRVYLQADQDAHAFYSRFCAQAGYHLRLREDGSIGVGVPADLSNDAFEAICDQVYSYGDALLQVLKDKQVGVAA